MHLVQLATCTIVCDMTLHPLRLICATHMNPSFIYDIYDESTVMCVCVCVCVRVLCVIHDEPNIISFILWNMPHSCVTYMNAASRAYETLTNVHV